MSGWPKPEEEADWGVVSQWVQDMQDQEKEQE